MLKTKLDEFLDILTDFQVILKRSLQTIEYLTTQFVSFLDIR